MRQWLAKRKVLLTVTGLAVLLFASIAIPNMLPPRFESSGNPLAVRVRVTDRATGTPVQGAIVQVPGCFERVWTDADGYCQAIGRFLATGSVGRSGFMHLYGTVTVTAPGYQTWEQSLPSLFGARYNYFDKGTSVTCAVTLAAQKHTAYIDETVDIVAGKDIVLPYGRGVLTVKKRDGSSLDGIRLVQSDPDGSERIITAETGTVTQGPKQAVEAQPANAETQRKLRVVTVRNPVNVTLFNANVQTRTQSGETNVIAVVDRMDLTF